MMPVASAPMTAGGVGKARRVPVTNTTALVLGAAAGGSGMAAASADQSPVDAMLEPRARTTGTRATPRVTGPTATRVRTMQTDIAGARGTQADTAGCGVESLEAPIKEGAADVEERCRLTRVTAITTVLAIPIMGALVMGGSPFGIDGMPAGGEAARGRGGTATQALLGTPVAGEALRHTMTALIGTGTESGMAISVGPRRTCGTRATTELMMHTMPIERQTSLLTPGTGVARNTHRTAALQMDRRGVRPGGADRTGGQVQMRYTNEPTNVLLSRPCDAHGTHALWLAAQALARAHATHTHTHTSVYMRA
jgi:hypothetical protein